MKEGTGHPCSVTTATSLFSTSKYFHIFTLPHSTLTFWPRGVMPHIVKQLKEPGVAVGGAEVQIYSLLGLIVPFI